MLKIISIIFLALLVGLFPPATLAFISQDALPENKIRYPIKRSLERGILFISSIHPATKAYFAVARSQRRFKEATTLIGSKKDAEKTLMEFTIQTGEAVQDIKTVNSASRKSELISDLSKSVLDYEKQLNQIQTSLDSELIALDITSPTTISDATPITQTPISTTSPSSSKTQPPAPLKKSSPRVLPPQIMETPEAKAIQVQQKQIQNTQEELKKIQEEIRIEQEKLREEAAKKASESVTTIPESGEIPPISEDIQNISGLDLLLEQLYKVNINPFKDLIPE